MVIAELSGNHSQDFELAQNMVKAAAGAGVDAIKLQTYTADSMTLDVAADDFMITEENSLWQGESLYNLYAKAATPYEWHKPLFELANSLGMLAFSSPFDEDAVDFLDDLGVPCFKIASFELTDIPLITRAAATGKPLIMSTGMASCGEIEEALDAAKSAGAKDIVLLKCTSTYPASEENTNLHTIADMRARFNTQIGLSDHTLGTAVAVASVALGATVIEKHFVMDRSAGGVDAAFSLEPKEFARLVTETRSVARAMGDVVYGGSDVEQKSKKYRRSIYVCQNIKKGQTFTRENLKVIRPSTGLEPKHFNAVLGKVASEDLPRGTALQWSCIKDI